MIGKKWIDFISRFDLLIDIFTSVRFFNRAAFSACKPPAQTPAIELQRGFGLELHHINFETMHALDMGTFQSLGMEE